MNDTENLTKFFVSEHIVANNVEYIMVSAIVEVESIVDVQHLIFCCLSTAG